MILVMILESGSPSHWDFNECYLFGFLCFYIYQQKQQLPDMEFGRRMATERDLEKTDTLRFSNVGNELE